MGEEQSLVSTPPSTTGEENLRRIIDEIESLSALSHTIRVFSVKWQVIRKKLDELTTFLVAAEVSHGHPTQHTAVQSSALGCNPINSIKTRSPLRDAFMGISNTVNESRDLAARCIDVSYNGKLRMQSDLDKVISKLDTAVTTLAAIFQSSGVVTGGLSLVVVKPPLGAAREDMRFYIKDLLTRVKIGDTQMKKQALISLNEVIFEDDKDIKIVIEMGDFVILLAHYLDSSDVGIQEECALAIAGIAVSDSYRGRLVVSGVIPPLIRVVEKGSLRAKKHAIQSLERLTENGDNAWALSAHGGVTALLSICSNDHSNELELIGPSCWVLRNLVMVEEINRFMIDKGAISTCIKLMKGRDEIIQIGAIEFLQSMAHGDENVCQLVIKQGGIRGLVRVIEPESNSSLKLRGTALRAIENLCFSSMEHVNMLISYGFLDQLLCFLRKGDVSIQELAFKSACRLCGTSEDARKSMGDGGFMAEFVKFLEAKSYEIREMAAEALSLMVSIPKNKKKFANDDHNIGLILQLLDPKERNSGNFKFLLSILLSLSSCHYARKKISHSGYVKNIEKLADAGVSDAKKIVRKLSTNRFKNMLNGLWHS